MRWVMSDDEGGGGIAGILVTVGILALVNGLSYVFGWGWYFY